MLKDVKLKHRNGQVIEVTRLVADRILAKRDYYTELSEEPKKAAPKDKKSDKPKKKDDHVKSGADTRDTESGGDTEHK